MIHIIYLFLYSNKFIDTYILLQREKCYFFVMISISLQIFIHTTYYRKMNWYLFVVEYETYCL